MTIAVDLGRRATKQTNKIISVQELNVLGFCIFGGKINKIGLRVCQCPKKIDKIFSINFNRLR